MKLHRFDCAKTFYQQAIEYLLQHEVTHNLLLRLCSTLIQEPERYPESPYLAIVESNHTPVAIALRTPPFPLVLSVVQERAAIDLIAQDILARQPSLAGVNAPVAESTAFVAAWQVLTGQNCQLQRALRVHRLTRVQQITRTKGFLRSATVDDQSLLLQWHTDFSLEALGEVPRSSDRWLASTLKQGSAYLWQDEEPVSIACGNAFSDRGAVLNLVYTPPQYRKQGYASACVAELSQQLLERGHQFCVLFTDLANPTSNKIYRAIGYQPMCDWHHYCFQ